MKTKTLNQVADALHLKVEMQNRMDRVMHVHVHGDVDEFSKTGVKSQASVIDSAIIMLFPAKDAVKMPIKCSKMLAVLVPRRNAILA